MTENKIIFEQKGFRIMHLNVQHIIPKYDEIRHILTSSNDYKIDVLGLCETFLSESVVDFNFDIPGYQYLRKDRNHKKRWLVTCLYCKPRSFQAQTGS